MSARSEGIAFLLKLCKDFTYNERRRSLLFGAKRIVKVVIKESLILKNVLIS